ncbi:MAG: hypothetical protein JW959_02705 [Pirellulales bacterium]|nr:hypothetical protein [Pirellulales bacterium]
MYITIGIGTMLLGSWVLVSPVEEDNLRPIQPTPPPIAAAPQSEMNANQYGGLQGLGYQGYGGFRSQEDGSRYGPRANQPPAHAQPGGTGMPASPTDSFQGAGGLPLPPTADPASRQPPQGQTQPGAMDQAYGSAGTQMPMAPTAAARPAPSSYSPGRSYSSTMQQPSSGGGLSSFGGGSQTTQKAFSAVNPYSSGVSPYMNLFRNDTSAGTIDNYTTLVRPALEQRAANQQFNMDIYGLERRARIQQHSLQQMQQRERTLQGVGTPQYYMNYGGFYGNQGYGP